MKSLGISVAFVIGLAVAGSAAAQSAAPQPGAPLSGSGGSIQAPLFKAWIADYQKAGGEPIAYQGQNSAFGISQIEAKAADFGVTAMPISDADLKTKGLSQFPFVISGTVLVTNVPGLESGKLKLDGPALAAIFLGKITTWNDPALKALNPGVDLPDWPITVARRTDPASMTLLLTSYLSSVSPEWKAGPGAGETVNWPIGLGGKGNAGISDIMSGTMGTISYVEYAYALDHKLDLVSLKNHDGTFVTPSPAAFSAFAASAPWTATKGFGVQTLDQPGKSTWPLVLVSYGLLRDDADPDRAKRVRDFFTWGYNHGDADITTLGYAPVPASVKAAVQAKWK
ncbi:phosphate ABC transporter substrate-binding protein PstS [Caulobacter segnis]|uniref:Phosphate-binding protein PstS n=2 Tax=Caulobacter segnis TaxID=88688 RepID=D5VNZ3_CAUST|nr:phosphate ABC transporter substrate-binding protein PstS [Caulobacter segnis]ADG12216.1 phosphate ABC transporter, periplasmic phosphate-binding protein [Caulobacter segnis ATCC 21756]AVQ03814.1 phosphate ABC transporter substrate-binding protein PstS [Caulobacter segnis]